jgi:hypothetical protein
MRQEAVLTRSPGLPDKVREISEALRWSHVEFIKMKGGIAVRVTFWYHKGYRNPNNGAKYDNRERTFLFLPSRAGQLEFDLPIILFGIAYQRGLFRCTLEEMLDQEPSEVFLEKNADVEIPTRQLSLTGTLHTKEVALIELSLETTLLTCSRVTVQHKTM